MSSKAATHLVLKSTDLVEDGMALVSGGTDDVEPKTLAEKRMEQIVQTTTIIIFLMLTDL